MRLSECGRATLYGCDQYSIQLRHLKYWLACGFSGLIALFASNALGSTSAVPASTAGASAQTMGLESANPVNLSLILGLGLGLAIGLGLVISYQNRVRQLRKELSEQETILGTVLASTPILTLDEHGLILKANSAVAELFGLQPLDLVNLAFKTLVPGFDPENPDASTQNELSGLRSDQTSFPLSLQYSPIPGPTGRQYLALHLSDQSRWHAADAQARELHTQLNKVWRLNSLGEMAATLAHELNQPLSAAATYLHASQSETERMGKLGENASRTAGLAKEQLLRAGQIIRRMRDLLSLEVRSLDREHASSMVEDLSPVLTMIGSAKGVSISLEMDSANDAVRADRIQFQQAIVNLVRNGVEASWRLASPCVIVRGQATSETTYEVVVEDNGPGLPPEEIERMFQPMTSTKSGGMGLGLSVTRTIVERHGGRLVGAKSAHGGAAFSFNLIRDPLDRDL
jgi:two-component system sensor kinase FixL